MKDLFFRECNHPDTIISRKRTGTHVGISFMPFALYIFPFSKIINIQTTQSFRYPVLKDFVIDDECNFHISPHTYFPKTGSFFFLENRSEEHTSELQSPM